MWKRRFTHAAVEAHNSRAPPADHFGLDGPLEALLLDAAQEYLRNSISALPPEFSPASANSERRFMAGDMTRGAARRAA
ncbi:hypothetical protein CYMTET_23595 [Cymbomonas tetramitiformis]|uniref:Uncharacterized protein n=1 Tax=Cymbomonas tetramitiformis TaxID=36881 RepID=A0AAE0L0Y3_9CHLO|nr:hypothetical protein CYMTET_23595 [Cymbomonas tetramitiformis]